MTDERKRSRLVPLARRMNGTQSSLKTPYEKTFQPNSHFSGECRASHVNVDVRTLESPCKFSLPDQPDGQTYRVVYRTVLKQQVHLEHAGPRI